MQTNIAHRPTQRFYAAAQVWFLPCLLILAAALRIFMLEQDSLWNDELNQVLFGNGSLTHTLSAPAPPIDYLITHVMVHYVGMSEGILRLPSVLWGVLSVLTIYQLAQYLFDKPTARLSAILLAITPLAVQYSREVRYYSLPTFLILLSITTFVRAVDKNTRSAWASYAVVLVLALFTHFYMAQVVGILGLWLILFKRPARSVIRAFAITTFLAGFLTLTWFLYVRDYYLAARQLYNYPILSEILTAPFFDVSLGGAVLDPQAGLDAVRQKLFDYLSVIRWTVGIFWTLILCAMYLVLRRKAPRSFLSHLILLLLLFLGGIASALLADYISNYFFAARQFLFFTPMALLVISATYVYLVRQIGARLSRGMIQPWLSGSAVVLMALLSLWIWWEPLTDNYKPSKQDWRGTSRYLLRNIRSDDVLLTPFSDFIGFYAPEVLAQTPAQIPEDSHIMANLAQSRHRIWIVLVHSPLYNRPAVLSQWIAVNHLSPLMFGRDLEVFTYSSEDTF
jgi:uncharacterized membrane protein